MLRRWAGEWVPVREFTAGSRPEHVEGLRTNTLYWLVARDSRRLERPFTIREGRQAFW